MDNRRSSLVDWYRTFLLLAVMVTCAWPAITWACPMCKEALFDPAQLPQRLSTARGYAASIALMLGIPLLLIGGVIALIVRAQRRARTLR